MRNMSFAMTTQQFIDGSKTVTRRFGWWKLKPGDRIMAVEKAMGLKKGEQIKKLGEIEIISVQQMPLNLIDKADCVKEGFPDWEPEQFVDMLVRHYKIDPSAMCNRIEFRKVSEGLGAIKRNRQMKKEYPKLHSMFE